MFSRETSAAVKLRKLWPSIRESKAQKSAQAVVVTTLLGILVVWVITAFLILDKRQSLLEEKRQVLARVGSAVSAQTHQYFKVIEVFLTSADHWCAKNPGSDPRFDEDFNRLLSAFHETVHRQIDIRLFDEHGGVYFPPVKSEQPLGNYAQKDFFIAAAEQKQNGIFIGEPFPGSIIKRWVMPISYPLHAKPNGISVITAVIPLKTLEEVFEAAREKPNGSITLLRSDGTVMARAPRVEGMLGKSIASGKLISTLIKQQAQGDVIKVSDIDGRTRLISYGMLQDFPLITVATADLEDITFPSYEYSAYAVMIALSITLFMLATAILALKYLRLVDDTHSKLSSEAATDPLTGVANRRSLLRHAGNELLRGRRYGRPLSLLMMDLDHFKDINDCYGHAWGDEVLRKVVLMIQGLLRGTDLLGRYGGEEFAVLMPETTTDEAIGVAERIREKISQISIDTGNGLINIRVSIGVATLIPEETEIQSLINRADAALYAAKRSGRDRVVSFPEI